MYLQKKIIHKLQLITNDAKRYIINDSDEINKMR